MNRWVNALRKPSFLLGCVASLIIGFFIAQLFDKNIDVKYTESKRPTLIFNSKESLGLKLKSQNDDLIDNDVFVRSFIVWNKGNHPASLEDLRAPIRLSLKEGTLLSAQIAKASDSISNFRVIDVRPQSIDIEYDYFDPNSGFEIDIIYTSNGNSEVVFSGAWLMDKIDNDDKWYSTLSSVEFLSITFFLMLFLFIIPIVFILIRIRRNSQTISDTKEKLELHKKLENRLYFTSFVSLGVFLICLFSLIYFESIRLPNIF